MARPEIGALPATPSSSAPGDAASAGASGDNAALATHKHAREAFGTTAGTVTQGNDSRLSDARTPTGSAGGDLGGTYPNPTVAQASAAFSLTADITSTSTGTQANWAPTGIATASRIRWNGASAATIENLTQAADGRVFVIQNVTSGQVLTLKHNTTGSGTATNNFDCPAGQDLLIAPFESVVVIYDGTLTRWVVLDSPVGGAPSTLAYGQAAATGGSAIAADLLHAHGMPPALSPIPGPISGKNAYSPMPFHPDQATPTGGVVGPSLNTINAYPFFLGGGTINQIAFDVLSAVSSAAMRLGIYSDVGGVPTSLLADAGQVAAATTGIKTSGAISVTAAGWVWIAWVPQGAKPNCRLCVANGANFGWGSGIVGTLVTNTNQAIACLESTTTTSSTLPSSFGTISSPGGSLFPTIWVRLT